MEGSSWMPSVVEKAVTGGRNIWCRPGSRHDGSRVQPSHDLDSPTQLPSTPSTTRPIRSGAVGLTLLPSPRRPMVRLAISWVSFCFCGDASPSHSAKCELVCITAGKKRFFATRLRCCSWIRLTFVGTARVARSLTPHKSATVKALAEGGINRLHGCLVRTAAR